MSLCRGSLIDEVAVASEGTRQITTNDWYNDSVRLKQLLLSCLDMASGHDCPIALSSFHSFPGLADGFMPC